MVAKNFLLTISSLRMREAIEMKTKDIIFIAILMIVANLSFKEGRAMAEEVPVQADNKASITTDKCSCERPMEAWDDFNRKNEKYVYHFAILWNDETCTPQDIFGPLSLKPYLENESLNEGNIEQVTRRFILDYKKLLGVDDVSNLVKQWFHHENNGWFLRYQQYYKGILVEMGEVTLSIEGDGIISFGSVYFPKLDISVKPTIDKTEAIRIADETTHESRVVTEGETKASLMIHKISKKCFVYKLVWNIEMKSMQILVDAHSGEVLESYSLIKGGLE